MKMQAVKAMTYGTRRLVAGDVFDASARDARILTAIGKASAHVVEIDPMDALRAEAEALGVKVDGRWKEAKLRDEIAKVKGEADAD